jgi:L-cysteine S-thiosulfotransferase
MSVPRRASGERHRWPRPSRSGSVRLAVNGMAACLLWLLWLSQAQGADAEPEAGSRRSGFVFMSPQTQAMQRDDSLNPGMLWVREGEELWQRREGPAGKSCAACHEPAATSMRGVAARYPAFDAREQRPIDLAQRVNLCRTRHLRAPALVAEGQELLSLTAYVALQSRGLPITPAGDLALAPHRERGAALFRLRLGQLDLACASCHDTLQGRRLGGSVIPPADASPYPAYRLEWQTLGSLQRRMRNCLTGIRAEPFAYGSAELIELELYLATRARGLVMEAPGVRP